MGFKKLACYAILPVLLGYFVVSAHASRPGGSVDHAAGTVATSPAAMTILAHILPRLAIPACAGTTVATAMAGLRRTVDASGLLHETRLSEAKEKQAMRALWAPIVLADMPPGAAEKSAGAPVLLPGQD